MRHLSRSLALLVGAGLAVQALGEQFEIKPKFEKDRPVYIEIEEKSHQTVTGAQLPQPMKIESRSLYGFRQETTEASDGQAKVKLTFERRAMGFKHPAMGEMEFDTDSGEKPADDNSMSLIAAPFVDQSLTLTVKDRAITDVEGFDKLQAAVEDSAMGDMFYEQSRETINAETLKNELLGARLHIYPREPVAVSDTWQNTWETTDPFLGKLVTTYNCTLEQVDKQGDAQLAHIRFEAETKLAEGVEAPVNSMGMQPTLKDLQTKGTAVVNIAQGRVQSATHHTTGTIALGMPAGETGQAGPGIDIAIDSKGTTRVLTPEQRAEEKASNKAALAERKAASEKAKAAEAETPGDAPESP